MAIVSRISFSSAGESRIFEVFNGQLTAQSSLSSVTLSASNTPADQASWQPLGTVAAGYAPLTVSTGLSHIRAVAAGPTEFAASDIDQVGSGGGGCGDASAANQVAQTAKLTSIDLGGAALAQIIDTSVAGTTYICEAQVGTAASAAAWRVQRIVDSGTVKEIRWAGTGAFDQVADNRLSLTYS